jgi:probable phosphoglycerate mutase
VRTVAPGQKRATRVVLGRHGEATCNVEGVVGGPSGCTGLSPTGRREARSLLIRFLETGELADAEALYASVLARARETATIAAPGIGAGRPPVADCELCELHPTEADGLRWEEFRRRYG